MSVNNCSGNSCSFRGYIHVEGWNVSITPLAKRTLKRIGSVITHGTECFVNLFHIANGLIRASGGGGLRNGAGKGFIQWGNAVFRFLDKARIIAVLLVPIHAMKIKRISQSADDTETKACKMAPSVSRVYHGVIMGAWALAGWFGKYEKASQILTPFWGFGCVFRIGEIAHSRWEKRVVGALRQKIAMTSEENLLNAFSKEELTDFFQVPEENLKTVHEDVMQVSRERVKEYLNEKLDRKEKQIKLATISATVSFISSVILLAATALTPAGPLALAVYGIAYGLFVVAGVTGLMEWREEIKCEGLKLKKGRSVELQEIEPSQENTI